MIDWLGPLMFAGALALLSLGYPVAFSLGGVSIIFALIGSALGIIDLQLFGLMPLRDFRYHEELYPISNTLLYLHGFGC